MHHCRCGGAPIGEQRMAKSQRDSPPESSATSVLTSLAQRNNLLTKPRIARCFEHGNRSKQPTSCRVCSCISDQGGAADTVKDLESMCADVFIALESRTGKPLYLANGETLRAELQSLVHRISDTVFPNYKARATPSRALGNLATPAACWSVCDGCG